ncbi:MAG TPA: alpha/beta fold hydrolase [Janthinobacterium sp.]|jgi:pimeloyl-ACP methyl ester carboxylesterase|nr:alpha/beta fold hydrolase [Janthinobacterium sp.]
MKYVNCLLASLLFSMLGASSAAAADFFPCVDAHSAPSLNGTLCASEVVPLSYGDAQLEGMPSVTLFVREFPALKKSRGTVWLVAGGPGESGASLYPFIGVLRRSFPDFDLILPDHRGSGFSSRLCPKEEGVDSPGGTALQGAEWDSCFEYVNEHADQARAFTLSNGARDLAYLIRQTRPDKPVYLYGVSYGTQLVLRALQLGKLPLAGVILDSLTPLETAPQWDLSQRSRLADAVGRQVLAGCDDHAPCHAMLGEPAETAYRRLLASAQEKPQLLAAVPGKDLKLFFGSLLDMPALRARIPFLIKELQQGHDEELKSVLASMARIQASLAAYPQSPASIPLASLIGRSENDLRPDLTPAQLQQEDQALLFTSSLPALLAKPVLPVYPRDEYFGKQPQQFPPLLVLNGTLDAKSPYEGALEHVAALRKVGKVSLVSVTGAPRFILWNAPACFERQVRDFVGGKTVPDQSCAMAAGESAH